MSKTEPDANSDRLVTAAEMMYLRDRSRKDVAAKFSTDPNDPLSETNVNHWIAEAKRRGVLVFDIDGSFAIQGDINSDLADQLIVGFQLEKALVVDVSTAVQQDIKAGDLHTILANRTGIAISGDAQHPGPVTANACVFCAGGRTVIQVARKISRKRLSMPGVRIDPLSGRMWTGSWQAAGPDLLERPLDADDAARTLASAFPTDGTRFSQIGSPLYAETVRQAKTIMRDHCPFLPGGKWNWDIPRRKTKIALCGIGALYFSSGHRVMRFLDAYLKQHGISVVADLDKLIEANQLPSIDLPPIPDKSAPYLSRVAADLLAAMTFAAKNHLGVFADVANRLYPCVPLPGELVPGKLPSRGAYEELLGRIGVLNDRAVVADWSHLRDASTWVIAGGALKLRATWSLAVARYLEQQVSPGCSSIMSQLTTDAVTARQLVDAIDRFKATPDRVQTWYGDLIKLLFPL